MNLQTVAANLRNTIAGKEQLLATYKDPSLFACHRLVKEAMIQFLETNIDELKRILQDVEQCTYSQADIDNYEQRVAKDVEQSWRDNPDRMGGQFTQDEIDNAEKW